MGEYVNKWGQGRAIAYSRINVEVMKEKENYDLTSIII